MTTAKWTINTREQQDLHHSAARFNEKGCLWVWGRDALRCLKRGIRGGGHLILSFRTFRLMNPWQSPLNKAPSKGGKEGANRALTLAKAKLGSKTSTETNVV